ncbi:ATP-, maltotriose-and DNA-dependent transcriptional regulator MalT [Amycolatopsis xylanica]|uniref:ATP-, maltotriose-and DNA-dependent transcriptional regulator MalT n=1 Tax=Amycolatopsis xylanica TaxID=589385 RepID=A0A1H3JQA9_9PSEU|nr:FxSxx-COOH system tetratricopeptide repeat protein [Amycolatopsis xylanica]SDY41558.1 ATP-, maltotriose-and DNA-dependent transcriptional regulator MalT [Amycolatopsis xylanica]
MTDRHERLTADRLEPSEIADALWLADRIGEAERARHAAEARALPDLPAPAEFTPPGPPPESLPRLESWDAEEPAASGNGVVAIETPAHTQGAVVREGTRWPQRSGLPQELKIARALRPMMRTEPSATRTTVDEEATAIRAAETGLWLPARVPAQEHPHDVVLVVDDSASMRIWRRTAFEFRTLLERQGAFRDVRQVLMDTDARRLAVRGGGGAHRHDPGQLVDPTGRRIIVVLTDGVGECWRTGAVRELLVRWRRSSPVAVVNVLPPELWSWTGMRVLPSLVRPPSRGPVKGPVQVPVLALEPRWFTRWAELMTGESSARLRLPVLAPPPAEPEEPLGAEELSPSRRLLRFRTTATPGAFRLAGLLAAAPLTIGVMKAVQDTLAPESGQAQLAEILLSRLLFRVSNRKSGGMSVEYDFHPGLRPQLLATASRSDTARVLRVVGDVLGPKIESVRNQRHVVEDPDKATQPVVSSDSEPFLTVQRDVLTALSGPYGRRASRLGEALDAYRESSNAEAADANEKHEGGAVSSPGPTEGLNRFRTTGDAALTATSSEQVSHFRSSDQPNVWGGVPLRNVNFTGRAELLRSLRDRLSDSTPTAVLPGALHGLGGIGKTQIAVEYVYRYAADYDLVWWISAENPPDIRNSLVQLAKKLKLPVEQSADTAVPAVLETLRLGEPYGRWLLVFDNADRPEDVRGFFPSGLGHILVTSRNAQWSKAASPIEVEVFQREESRELLQRRNADLSDDEADQLAEVLGDLPLAVEQAAAWRAETGMSTEEYLRLFEDKRTELLQSNPPVDYPLAVEAAWNVSLDRLAKENPGALELLQVCAFFAPEPISRALFNGVRNIPLSEALEKILSDPILVGRAIREINRYSLAKIDHRSNTIGLHRLVQTVLRNKLTPDEQIRTRHSAHLLLSNSDPNDPNDIENWQRYGELRPHVRACVAMDCSDEWVRRMAINVVVYLFAAGDPKAALSMSEDMVTYWTEKLGESHQDTLVVSRWYARSLRAVGRFDEARRVAERTLDLMRETLGPAHEETLLTAHSVASDLRAKGDFAAARDLNKIAYESARSRFGDDDPDTLAAANNYALSLRLVGDFGAALSLDMDTWERKRDVLGPEHRNTLLTLDNLSVDLRENGQYGDARNRQEETVHRLRARVGPQHVMTLGAIKNLAVARRKAGDHAEGMRLSKEAYDGFRRKYGVTHPDAMSAAMNYSIDLRQAGDKQGARKLGTEINKLYVASWGPKHPFSLAGATNLAVTLRLLGELDAARALNESALTDLRTVLGDDHPFTLVCATNLASDKAAAGELEAAYELDVDTRERSTRTLGANHPSTLALLVNLALDMRGLGRRAEADELQAEAVNKLRAVLGAEHPATNDATVNVRANCDIDPMQI